MRLWLAGFPAWFAGGIALPRAESTVVPATKTAERFETVIVGAEPMVDVCRRCAASLTIGLPDALMTVALEDLAPQRAPVGRQA